MPKRIFPSEGVLRALYWDQELTCREIAKMYGGTVEGVYGALRRFSIPRRTKRDGILLTIRKGLRRKRKCAGPFKDALRCHKCCWAWKRELDSNKQPCPRCGHYVDARKRRIVMTAARKEVLKRLNSLK